MSEDVGDVLDLGFWQAGYTLDLVGRPFRNFLADILDAVDALVDEFLVLPTVLENVPEHPVDGRNVHAGPYPDIFGCVRRGSRHARVNDDQVCAVEFFAFENMLQRNRMGLSGVAAHQQDRLRVADVVVAVRHRTVAPGVGDSSDGGGVTDARLMIGIVRSPEGSKLSVEICGFVCELGRTKPIDRIRTRLPANVQEPITDLIDSLIPRNPLPLAIHQLLRITQTSIAQDVVPDRCPFAAM